MYCTGGIRCEKASAWMKHQGFKNIFQLEGGIIKYTKDVKEQGLENRFIGKNFVFDERLGERITEDIISVCHQCGNPCDDHTNCKNDGCHLLFIQCKSCAEKFNGCCSAECNEILTLPHDAQKEIRKGVNKGRQVFKKGRSEKIPFMKDKPKDTFPGPPPMPSEIKNLMERNKREELEKLEKADQAAIRSGAITNTTIKDIPVDTGTTTTGTDTTTTNGTDVPKNSDTPVVVKPVITQPPVKTTEQPPADKPEGTKRKGKKGDGR
jgi:hypothetical protein